MIIKKTQHWHCKHFTDTVIIDKANSLDEWLSRNIEFINPIEIIDQIQDKINFVFDKKNWKTKSQKKIDKMVEIFNCFVYLRFDDGRGLNCTRVVKKEILNISL